MPTGYRTNNEFGPRRSAWYGPLCFLAGALCAAVIIASGRTHTDAGDGATFKGRPAFAVPMRIFDGDYAGYAFVRMVDGFAPVHATFYPLDDRRVGAQFWLVTPDDTEALPLMIDATGKSENASQGTVAGGAMPPPVDVENVADYIIKHGPQPDHGIEWSGSFNLSTGDR